MLGEQVHDGGATFGIADGGDVTLGLVEEEVDEGLRALQGLAIDANDIAIAVGLGALLGDDGAIESDASGGDNFLRFAAGGDAGGGEDFL